MERNGKSGVRLPLENGQWLPVDVKHLGSEIERLAPSCVWLFSRSIYCKDVSVYRESHKHFTMGPRSKVYSHVEEDGEGEGSETEAFQEATLDQITRTISSCSSFSSLSGDFALALSLCNLLGSVLQLK